MGEYKVTWKGKARDYQPSTSEKLLEKMCRHFGGELLPAFVEVSPGGAMLVRLAMPAVIDCQRRLVLASQLTRFEPYSNMKWWKRMGLTGEKVETAVRKKHKQWNPLVEVIDREYIEDPPDVPVTLKRWPKCLCWAIYDLDVDMTSEERQYLLKPQHIYEPDNDAGQWPLVHIALKIEPIFFISRHSEDTSDLYDQLTIGFPAISNVHREALDQALRRQPLDRISESSALEGRAWSLVTSEQPVIYRLHSEVPREATMGLIETYLETMIKAL